MVTFVGPQGEFAGLDQVNVLLPRSLAEMGEVDVEIEMNVGGVVPPKYSNRVRVQIK